MLREPSEAMIETMYERPIRIPMTALLQSAAVQSWICASCLAASVDFVHELFFKREPVVHEKGSYRNPNHLRRLALR